jgi:hypothetical protein
VLPCPAVVRPAASDEDETIGADWFTLADIDHLDIHRSMRLRIDHAIHHPDTVNIT